MNYQELLKQITNPKTKKLVKVEIYYNDWLVQVIVENKLWNQTYFAIPPLGVPEFVASSRDEAESVTWEKAYHATLAWIENLLQEQTQQ